VIEKTKKLEHLFLRNGNEVIYI